MHDVLPRKEGLEQAVQIEVLRDEHLGDVAAAKAAGGALSCDKAGQIISGYGFSAVKPSVCTGKVYAFNATRDGNSFAIKLDSGSGELTEVKKQ